MLTLGRGLVVHTPGGAALLRLDVLRAVLHAVGLGVGLGDVGAEAVRRDHEREEWDHLGVDGDYDLEAFHGVGRERGAESRRPRDLVGACGRGRLVEQDQRRGEAFHEGDRRGHGVV